MPFRGLLMKTNAQTRIVRFSTQEICFASMVRCSHHIKVDLQVDYSYRRYIRELVDGLRKMKIQYKSQVYCRFSDGRSAQEEF